MKTVVGIEWRHLRRFLRSVVVSELCERKQVEPVVLFVVAEDAEIGFQSLIHAFCLTIRLWVERCRLASINAENRQKRRPEMRCKNGSAVGDNCIGDSMKSDDVGDEELGEVWSIESLGAWNEVTHLGHSINEHEDRVLAA